MGHPITGKRRSIVLYCGVWLIIAVLHGMALWYIHPFPAGVIITEALLVNVVFASLGLLAWYPTRYIPFQRQNPVYSITAHMVAGLLVVFLWMLLTVGLLGAIFHNRFEYLEFLRGSLVWRAVLGGLLYLTLVLIYYLVVNAQKLQERAKQEEMLKSLVRDTELNMLKAQINPHFLFNSLNSISSLIMSNPDEARDMIIKLSDFLRYSLKYRENEFVPLSEEVVHMQDYMAIEKVRFGSKLLYNFELGTACEEVLVPTMIFQPLFENAVKHGVYESLDPVRILFHCELQNVEMKVMISNNFDPEAPLRRGTGVGLQNVRRRIDLAYDGRGFVKWEKGERNFTVLLIIPVKK